MQRSLVKPAALNELVATSSADFICASPHDPDRTSTWSPITVTVDHSRARFSDRSKSAAIGSGAMASRAGTLTGAGTGATLTVGELVVFELAGLAAAEASATAGVGECFRHEK